MKQFITIFFVLALCARSFSLAANNPSPKPCACDPVADSLELVAFYQNFNGDGWTNRTNWLVDGMPIGTWYGVVVNAEGCVRALKLPNNQLNGALYDFNLPDLDSLGLYNNQINGEIPDFSFLPKLQYLLLNSNQITGPVPDFSSMPVLIKLDLRSNQMTGAIPNFTHFTNLRILWIGNNKFEGSVPDFSNLPTLIELSLPSNQLTGTVPDFSNLPILGVLGLRSNMLTGGIPDFSNLPVLHTLDIASNPIGGELIDFSNLPNLGALFLGSCQLSGEIPDFANIPKLTLLQLYSNQLTGEIPDFSNLPMLGFLTLNNNKLTGTIPEFSNVSNLSNLEITSNQLSGEIPAFNNLTKLEHLSLGFNKLTGEIPEFLNSPKLKTISLTSNQLSGQIPNFSNAVDLDRIRLGSNQLSGQIPSFTNSPMVTEVSLSSNQLSGQIPSFSNLPKLYYLSLNSNKLTGQIPDFSGLTLLQNLFLSYNQLSGHIPDFSNLPKLEYLWLHNNQISGNMPDFAGLPNLIDLYCNSNQLSGQIPSFTNTPKLKRLFLNSNQLSGPIPSLPNLNIFWVGDNLYTFSNILSSGNVGLPGFSYIQQKPFYPDTAFNVEANQAFQINLGIDSMLTDNFYTWWKDSIWGQLPPGFDPHINKLIFPSIQASDAGRYYVWVENPQAPNLQLYSKTIILQVCDERLDSLELVKLYNNTGGANWTNQTNWLTPGMPINTWHGVSSDEFGCVQKLDLTGNNLVGTLPVLSFNTLDSLILEDNLLVDTIPELDIPFVRYFNLSKNQFVGKFPIAMNNWYDLRGLDLSNNALDGPIPPDLGDLCELTSLHLNNNQIVGELPEQLTMLFNLQFGEVDFRNNLIDSLKDKIIWFCPYGDTILLFNFSYDRFAGICNVECKGDEWDNLNAFPWIADTLESINCNDSNCVYSPADAGFVDVRGLLVLFTRTRCYTSLGQNVAYTEEVSFFDCAGHLLEFATCDQNQFCTDFGALSKEEFDSLEYDIRWSCGQEIPMISSVQESWPSQYPGTITIQEALHCYPNPANLFVYCENTEDMSSGKWRLIDMFGRNCPTEIQTELTQVRIDIQALPSGIYFVESLGKAGKRLSKLVVH
jgi:Leucine-rich repeat (LRR) protein